MSGIIARVLVVLFGLSFGCGLVREMISRRRNAKTARRQLVEVDKSTHKKGGRSSPSLREREAKQWTIQSRSAVSGRLFRFNALAVAAPRGATLYRANK
jgi:hypothetical protein